MVHLSRRHTASDEGQRPGLDTKSGDAEFYIVAIKHHTFRCEIGALIHTMAYRNLRSSL